MLMLCLEVFPQNAPQLTSVAPEDGATRVPTTSALVFTFDQAMDTTVTIVPSTQGLVGTFKIEAPGFNQYLIGKWIDDRTLSLAPSIQFPYATFVWTLNPTGSLALFRVKSKAGVELATVSGTFTTGVGGTAPQLGSSIPLNNATGVELDAVVQFRFNQAMKPEAGLSGTPPAIPGALAWTGNGLDPQKFTYSWSQDGRTLFCDYQGDLPLNTVISWVLNPETAQVKLQNTEGLILATNIYSGQFMTRPTGGCDNGEIPEQWRTFVVNKSAEFLQVSNADPIPDDEGTPAFTFSAFVSVPGTNGNLIAASVARPGVTNEMTLLGTLASTFTTFDTEAAMESAVPPGDYVLHYTLAGRPEISIAMSMPSDTLPTPRILNLSEVQTLDPTKEVTLHWNGFTGAADNDYLSVLISDTNGTVVFQAPDYCLPRELPVTATSSLIPANTFRTDQTYTGSLIYGHRFHYVTNAPSLTVAGSAEIGQIVRSTRFLVKTSRGGGGVSGQPSTISRAQLLSNGNPQFTINGTANSTYAIERTGSTQSPTWLQVGVVTLGSDGTGSFEDNSPAKSLPLFYRIKSETLLPP